MPASRSQRGSGIRSKENCILRASEEKKCLKIKRSYYNNKIGKRTLLQLKHN